MGESKEALALYVLNATGEPSTNHDDKLTLRMYKGDYATGDMVDGRPVVAKGIGLDEGWRESPDIEYEYKDGARILNGYHNGLPEPDWARLSVKEYEALPAGMKSQWRPYWAKCIQLGEGVKLAFGRSTVELRLYNLFDKWSDSRYTMVLEHMADLVNKGILKYKPSTGEPTEKRVYNAIRNRVMRSKQMFEYEHDTLLSGAVGRPIYEYLRGNPTPKMLLDDNTIYVQGFNKASKPAKSVKIYDTQARDGLEPAKMYKIETTLRTPYFNKHGITIDSLTRQPIIMQLIKSEIEESLVTVLKALSRGVLVMTAEAYRVERRDMTTMPRQIARAMLGNTLTQDVAELKRKVAVLERDMEQVKRATGLK